MAILSDLSSNRWTLIFNIDPQSIPAADIIVDGTAVSTVSGMGNTRIVVLPSERSELEINDITLQNTQSLVIDTQNNALNSFFNQIRSLLNISTNTEDLPYSKIARPFLRSAEFDIYKILEITESAYDTRAASEDIFQERTRIAVLYQTAALLVPALPDIVEERVLNELTRYVEFDPQEKIAYFLRLAKDEIVDFLPPGTVTGSGVPIKTIRKCRVLF